MSAAPPLECHRHDWCDDCGARHSPERRRAILLRYSPETPPSEIAMAWPHIWPDGDERHSSGRRLLDRDRAALGWAGKATNWDWQRRTRPARSNWWSAA